MNNVIMRKITVGITYQPLATVQTVATVTISASPANAGNVLFLGDTGQEVPWVPGEWHTLHHVDLASIQVKGTAGDVLTVVGGTW